MKIKTYHQITPELAETIESLEQKVFSSGYQEGRFTKELKLKTKVMVQLAFDGNRAVGFKVGYEKDESTFYSWLGGVIEEYRNQGIASQLMAAQHEALKEAGYRKVQTTTRNANREMLILDLKKGFDIIGTHFVSDENRLSIILEKNV